MPYVGTLKILGVLAIVGVLGFDGVSIGLCHISTQDDANSAALAAMEEWGTHHNINTAYEAAQQSAAGHGETVLKERLGPLAALAYWLACLGLTTVAILMALLDVRAVQSRRRQEQRALFQDALKNIEAEARKRMPGNTGNNGRK